MTDLYSPLLWTLGDIPCCPIHQSILRDRCHQCGHSWRYSETEFSLRHCTNCRANLASSPPTAPATDEEKSVAADFAQFLAVGVPCGTTLGEIVLKCIAGRFSSLDAAAAHLGFRSNYFYQADRIRRTSIANFHRIAKGLGLTLVELLCESDSSSHVEVSVIRQRPTYVRRPRHNSTQLALRLAEIAAPTPRSAARSLGVSSVTLRNHCKKLYDSLSQDAELARAGNANNKRQRLEKKIRAVLTTAFESSDSTISVQRITRQIGFIRDYPSTKDAILKLVEAVLTERREPAPTEAQSNVSSKMRFSHNCP